MDYVYFKLWSLPLLWSNKNVWMGLLTLVEPPYAIWDWLRPYARVGAPGYTKQQTQNSVNFYGMKGTGISKERMKG